MAISRRRSVPVLVGNVAIGGDAPVVVQSMTNTDTADVASTVAQTADLARAGSELVRITVNTREAARAVAEIRARLDDQGIGVPLIGDFHYNGHILLVDYPDCARALAKYRINPGNVGPGRTRDANYETMIKVALDHDRPVRIGVNWGSLDQQLLAQLMDENARKPEPQEADAVLEDAIVASGLRSIERARELGLGSDRIVLSAKVSRVPTLLSVYRRLATATDVALHLGLTEAGMGSRGIAASSAALGILLAQGIGDTIRVSLTPEPDGDRTLEVRVCQQILQALGLRSFTPAVTACPGCGRTTSTVFQELAQEIEAHIEARMVAWKARYPGVESMSVAVMGCVVNGPGESRHSDIGISLPGTGEEPKAPVYVDGAQVVVLKGPTLARDFLAMLEDYVERRYGGGPAGGPAPLRPSGTGAFNLG